MKEYDNHALLAIRPSGSRDKSIKGINLKSKISIVGK